jgi:hypothetical protein
MLPKNEPLGDLVKCLLIHMKSIQVRMQYTTHQFKGDSKYRINQCINKVSSAIDGICSLTKNEDVVRLVKKELEKADLVYHMVLAEQLYDADEETLREVTDLIDNYLLEKEKKKNGKDKMGTGESS